MALDLETGEELWATQVGQAVYGAGVGSDDGPRSTPSVDGGSVYVLTSYLKLLRLSAVGHGVSPPFPDVGAL